MSRLFSFLRQEIMWGQVVGIAFVATLLAGFAYTGAQNNGNQLLYILSLVSLAVGGIIVGQRAPRHPFWNGFFYAIFCDLFAAVLLTLYSLGLTGEVPTLGQVGGGILYLSVFILPQSLAGAWMAISFQRIRELGRDADAEKESQKKKESRATTNRAEARKHPPRRRK